jgi:two-component system response regulator AtoC
MHPIRPQTDKLVDLACRSDVNVLITGPTGTGKSRLAEEIHRKSARRGGPFVVVNLASLHEGTLESELFGHERGAFTGADSRRTGRLEQAQGGTVFLDEIGELTPRLQARLLEFLQAKRIVPVGGSREARLDVRVIAATHRNLPLSVAAGAFREDLFHRLRVIAMELPPLIHRSDEFDTILHACLDDICARTGRRLLRLSAEVAEALENHDWPGNIRELRNVLEFAVLASDSGEVRAQDLPAWFGAKPEISENVLKTGAVDPGLSGLDYASAMSRFEKSYLALQVDRSRGRISQTARRIGMSKTTLLRRLKEYGLTGSPVSAV